MSEQLPVCSECKHEPGCTDAVPERWVCCTHRECVCAGWDMPESMWRRLMTRPRLAPEHVVWLRGLMSCGYVSTEETAAIRAALAALVEE